MKTRGRTGLIGDGGRRLVGAGSEGGAKGRAEEVGPISERGRGGAGGRPTAASSVAVSPVGHEELTGQEVILIDVSSFRREVDR